MFGQDFFPTPPEVIDQMIIALPVRGKVILEPSAGKGNIVDRLLDEGADVLACELNEDLAKIVGSKCRLLCNDFLSQTSDRVSHIHGIFMNPPFSADEKHINHAYDIAPAGCTIVALCNQATLDNPYSKGRQRLETIISENGHSIPLGDCFSTAERKTSVKVAMIVIQKPGGGYAQEFEGFFLEDDPEEAQENGITSYNAVRDLVNRYVAAIKLFDEQLAIGSKMDSLLSGYYGANLAFTCTQDGQPKLRNEFKKDLQKAGWNFIFDKMNLGKFATQGLREDINRFVEQQQNIPFTMKNIYVMLDIVIGTREQRMDKALLEVFDRVIKHSDDNRYNLPGWKTNGHYLVNQKFIMDGLCYQDQRFHKGESRIQMSYDSYRHTIEDFAKALCYLTGDDYDKMVSLSETVRNHRYHYGGWFTWGYFKCKAFKKGTMHFEFLDEDLWAKFNQRIAKLKGYPLFEGKEQTAYQNRQTGRAQQQKASKPAQKAKVLFTAKIA
jgi:hypothetical protein